MSNGELTHDEARRQILEGGDVERNRLMYALANDGAPFPGGLPCDLLARLLCVHPVDPWNSEDGRLFEPHIFHDGMRLPEDITEVTALQVRALIAESKNDGVRAHLSELLYARFKTYSDVEIAIKARLSVAKSFDAENRWPEGMGNVGRLGFLLRKFNKTDLYDPFIDALDEVRKLATESTRPWTLGVLTRNLCNTVLGAPVFRTRFTAVRAKDWMASLVNIAQTHASAPMYGEGMIEAKYAWTQVWGSADDERACAREVVEQQRLLAKAIPRERSAPPTERQRTLVLVSFWNQSLLRSARRTSQRLNR
jgi:hypothetical protein